MNNSGAILETLTESDIYRDYEHAFSDATGLPVALREITVWQPSLRGKRRENSFCALMAGENASCAACLRMQERLVEKAADGPVMAKCHFGLTEVAVPVKLGEELLGFLTTGQVFTQQPGATQFRKASQLMKGMGIDLGRNEAQKAYLATRVMPRSQLASAMRLLEIFADHLAIKSNQIAVRQANAEPIAVVRAKAYIHQHLHEYISLSDIAKAAFTSTFHVCKLFKRHTGLNFTDYVSRLRIEKARELLPNPNLRISEIAFQVGFQSLTHFNRVFRRLVGEAPTSHRENIALPLAAGSPSAFPRDGARGPAALGRLALPRSSGTHWNRHDHLPQRIAHSSAA